MRPRIRKVLLTIVLPLLAGSLALLVCCSDAAAGATAAAASATMRKTDRGFDEPDIRGAIPGADVIIDAGHGGIDGGTHWNEVKESHINLAIGRKLYLLLRSQGVRAILNRTGDYALSDDNRWHRTRSRHRRDLSQRRGLSAEVEAELFVSLHANWSANARKRGPLVIYRRGDERSALLAMLVQEQLNRQQGTARRPQAADQYYLLNRATIPGAIVETAFLSHPEDRAMLTSPRGQTRIAEAIAAGIVAYRSLVP